MLCSVLSFSLSPLFLWVFFCCAFFKKWSSWFAQNSYCILKVALFLSLSRYSMGQGKRSAYFLYLLELSNNSRCFERRIYPFCNPCHHLTTIWSLPPSSYSVFPYWIYSILIHSHLIHAVIPWKPLSYNSCTFFTSTISFSIFATQQSRNASELIVTQISLNLDLSSWILNFEISLCNLKGTSFDQSYLFFYLSIHSIPTNLSLNGSSSWKVMELFLSWQVYY